MSKKRTVVEEGNDSSKRIKATSLEEALKSIKKRLMAIASLRDLDAQGALGWCKARGVDFPWPTERAPASLSLLDDLKFDFEAPKNIAVVGSFMLESGLADGGVDLLAEMPDETIFRHAEKDHINWKYWLRRSFYLAVLLAELKDAFEGSNTLISTELLHGNPFKPVICIKLADSERFIRVIPSLPWSPSFQSKLFRMSPQKSNVRAAWIAAYHGLSVPSEAREVPTPYYNSSLLSEALYIPHLIHLHACLSKYPVLAAALKLIKAWLRNANASKAFNGFTASMWLVDLVATGVIDPVLLDELQIFRISLQSWQDSLSTVLETGSFVRRLQGFPSETTFAGVEGPFEHGSLALLAGPLNLFYSTSAADLASLAQQANATLSFLQSHPDRLDRLFLASALKSSEALCDDLVFSFKFASLTEGRLASHLPAGSLANYGSVVKSGFLEQRIELVLRKGLTDRISGPIKVSFDPQESSFRLGMTLNSQNAQRIIDMGPSADQGAEAAKFRGFWGKRAELRQFKDSSIRECVAWEAEFAAKASIPSAIVNWLMDRHFGVKQVKSSSQELDFSRALLQADFNPFTAAFERLARELRGLSGSAQLPLSIVACIGMSPAHAQTSLNPLTPVKFDSQINISAQLPHPACPVYDFLLKFEFSPMWPDERQALQAARQAFLLQLARVLRGRGQECLVGRDFIDIFQDGFVFRGWMEVPRESIRCRAEGLNAEADAIEKRTFWQPRLTTALRQLTLRFAAFGPTCRLTKSFLSGQLIDFPDFEAVVDVLCAAVFLNAVQKGSALAGSAVSLLKTRPPGSARSGFLRVLDLLMTFPWTERPLVLDFTCLETEEPELNPSFKDNEATYSEEELKSMAGADWSLLTNARLTPEGVQSCLHVVPVFTKEQKAMLVNALEYSLVSSIPVLPFGRLDRAWLVRLRLLARVTLERISECVGDWSGFFSVGADAIKGDYDLLLKLDPEQLQLGPAKINGLAKMLRNANQHSPLLFSRFPGFSAAEALVSELQNSLKKLDGVVVAWNKRNPKIIGLRVRKAEDLDAVEEIVRCVGGDMILESKRLRK